MLEIPMFGQVNDLESFPVLPNLKTLEVRLRADAPRAIPVLTSFMKAFPNLQRLVLKLECFSLFTGDGEEMYEGQGYGIEKCPHLNIKVVEILGYRRLKCC